MAAIAVEDCVVDEFDEFLIAIRRMGLKIPSRYKQDASRLEREDLLALADEQLSPCTLKDYLVRELIDCRTEEWFEREKYSSPFDVDYRSVGEHWEEKHSGDFRENYVNTRFFPFLNSLNPSQIDFGNTIVKKIQESYSRFIQEQL